MLRALRDSLSSIIYPQKCRVCSGEVERTEDGVACASCWNETRFFTGNEMLCRKCGAFFAAEAAVVSVSCHKCDNHFYDKAAAAGVYEKALAASIVDLKTVPHLSKCLIAAISSAVASEAFADAELLVPIPLSRQRQHERGFNQAEIIAEAVSRATHISIDSKSLARKIHTQMHRVGMDQKARELTIHNTFEVTRPRLITGKTIVLIDDVLTSGATASQAAKVLKKNGAGRVNVFTLARAVMS
jgi:ComF family protein